MNLWGNRQMFKKSTIYENMGGLSGAAARTGNL